MTSKQYAFDVPGPRPFSEPETKAIADFIMDTERIKAYLTLHSYSQMWLLPWGYTKQVAKDHDDMMYLGRRAVEALQKVHGTNYKIGSSPQLLYPTSGKPNLAPMTHIYFSMLVYFNFCLLLC